MGEAFPLVLKTPRPSGNPMEVMLAAGRSGVAVELDGTRDDQALARWERFGDALDTVESLALHGRCFRPASGLLPERFAETVAYERRVAKIV